MCNPHLKPLLKKNVLFCFSDNFGEFFAEMVVVVDKDAYDAKDQSEMTVEQALTETVERGKIGLLSVDRKSLDLRAPGTNAATYFDPFYKGY
jgi:hypothetical protein